MAKTDLEKVRVELVRARSLMRSAFEKTFDAGCFADRVELDKAIECTLDALRHMESARKNWEPRGVIVIESRLGGARWSFAATLDSRMICSGDTDTREHAVRLAREAIESAGHRPDNWEIVG